ncbi:alpha/beta fold hydrolase [Actinoplanes sp. URMC 104]|uniref:alpha/beta fold hydrolase n=1 Tax=Actinoplanes sp. URMC 104 TaxID=3423409 RepID=UPI003F1CBC6E
MLHHYTLGTGPLVLLIHGGAEDAGMLEPQARALAEQGCRVIWYDRRGTGRNRGAGWATDRGDRHADDAAELIRDQGPATVLGFSSGGVVALALAARHADLVREVVAWEPAALGMLPDADATHAAIMEPIEAYLVAHPDDWQGAWRVALTVLSEGRADLEAPETRATMVNAEAAIRDDARQLTRRAFGPGELPADRVTLAVSEAPDPVHLEIAERVAKLIDRSPVRVEGAHDHEVYRSRPGVLATWLGARLSQE